MSRKRNAYLAGLSSEDAELPPTHPETYAGLEALPVIEFSDDSDFEDVHKPVRRRLMDDIFPPSADDPPPLPAVSDEELLAAMEKHEQALRDNEYDENDRDIQDILDGQLNGGVKKGVEAIRKKQYHLGYEVNPEVEPPAITVLRRLAEKDGDYRLVWEWDERRADKLLKENAALEVIDLNTPLDQEPVHPADEMSVDEALPEGHDDPMLNTYMPNFIDPEQLETRMMTDIIEPVPGMYYKRDDDEWDENEDQLDIERTTKLYNWIHGSIPQSIIKSHFRIREDDTGENGVYVMMAQCITRQLFDGFFDEESRKVMLTHDIRRLVEKLTAKLYLGKTPEEKEKKRLAEQRMLYQFLVKSSRTIDGKVWKAFERGDLAKVEKLMDASRYNVMRARRVEGMEKALITLQRKLRKIRDLRFIHDIPDGTSYLEAHRIANINAQRMCYTQLSCYGTLSRQRLWYAAWCLMHQMYSGSFYQTPVRDCLSRFPILPAEMDGFKYIMSLNGSLPHCSYNLTDLQFVNDYLSLTAVYEMSCVDGYNPFSHLGFGEHFSNHWISRFLMLPGVWDPLSYSKMIPLIAEHVHRPYDESALVFSPLLAFRDFGWAR